MQNNIFELNERLEKDSILIKKMNLCELRLMKDADLDWFVLIPRRAGMVEITDLSGEDSGILWQEINEITKILKDKVKPDKINIGMLGNVVSQLHIHIIARFKDDRAWPNAIWGTKAVLSFDEGRLEFWKKNLAL